MTIKITYDDTVFSKCQQIASTTYSTNIFYRSFPRYFVQLLYAQQFPNFLTYIETDIRFANVKKWLMSLFVSTTSSPIELTLEDRIKLVINGISHLPGCKCKLRSLKLLKTHV